jgi:putative membrane protein
MIGTLSKGGSQIALTRAAHPKVREFAQFEVDEQTLVAQVLTNVQESLPAPLSPMAQGKLSQLQSAGSSFDAPYVQLEIDGHQT